MYVATYVVVFFPKFTSNSPTTKKSRLAAGLFFFHDLEVTRSNYYYVYTGCSVFFLPGGPL